MSDNSTHVVIPKDDVIKAMLEGMEKKQEDNPWINVDIVSVEWLPEGISIRFETKDL
jgi:hypothetical protein